MATDFIFHALFRASFVGIILCSVSYTSSILNPRLGAVLLRPAHVVASLVSVLLVVLFVGLVFGVPEPIAQLYRNYCLT